MVLVVNDLQKFKREAIWLALAFARLMNGYNETLAITHADYVLRAFDARFPPEKKE